MTGFNERQFEKTELFQEQVEKNFNTVQNYWFRALKEGTVMDGVEFNEYNGVYVKKWLYDDYSKRKWGTYDKKFEYNEFFKQLYKQINDDELGIKVIDTKRVITWDDTEKPHDKTKQTSKTLPVIIIPDLETCRKVFNKKQQWEYSYNVDEIPKCLIEDD